MLVKLLRTNSHNEEKECVVNTDEIISIIEKHTEDIELYDAEGNLVETKVAPKRYDITLKGGILVTRIGEAEYQKLLTLLNVK
jgi:hypothetical protein